MNERIAQVSEQLKDITELKYGFDAMGFSQGLDFFLSWKVVDLCSAISQGDNSCVHTWRDTIPLQYTTSSRLALSI